MCEKVTSLYVFKIMRTAIIMLPGKCSRVKRNDARDCGLLNGEGEIALPHLDGRDTRIGFRFGLVSGTDRCDR